MSSSTLLSPPGPAPAGAPSPTRRPGEPGLLALALGLLALTCSVHPVWVLASVVLGVTGTAAGLRALLLAGERRYGGAAVVTALLGLLVASVTLPATIGAAASLLDAIAALRPRGG